LAYFDTGGASNGPTEAPTNYQLRMLLIAGGLDASTHTQL